MTSLTLLKSALNSMLNKLFGTNKTPYSPQYIRSQNQPSNKLAKALRDTEAAKRINNLP